MAEPTPASDLISESSSTSGLIFIDVDARAPIPVTVKEERASSPDETLSDVKNRENAIKLQCAECNFTCNCAERMTRHMRRVHRGENPFQCVMCDYSTYNSTLFREHVNIHQGIKPYKCKFCSYRSVSKKYIKLHESKHESCVCGFIGSNRRALVRHQKQNGCVGFTKKEYPCPICPRSFPSQGILSQHKRLMKGCQYCDRMFCSVVSKNQHMLQDHDVEKAIRAKKYKFNCSQCGFVSNTALSILLHIIHHPEQQLDGSIDVSVLIDAKILTWS